MLNKARDSAKIAGYCVPFILGIIAPLLITGIKSWSKLNSAYEPGKWILLCMSIFFFIAVISRFLLPNNSRIIVLLIYFGITTGIFIEEFGIRDEPSNLLPVGIILMWGISVIPIAIGMFVGRLIYCWRVK